MTKNIGIGSLPISREITALFPYFISVNLLSEVGVKRIPWNKGIKTGPLSEEVKKRMHKFLKGHVHSDETKKKISEKRKGFEFSEESLKKMSESHKGKKLSEETKKKISEMHKGKVLSKGKLGYKESKEISIKRAITQIENNKRERKDIGYCDIWRDKEYKEDIRKSGCEECGMSKMMSYKLFGKKLSLHHFVSNNNCAPDELKTLCVSCHSKIHGRKKVKFEKLSQ